MTAAVTSAAALAMPAAKETNTPGLDAAQVDFASAIESGLTAILDLREQGHGPATEKPKGYPIPRVADVISKPGVQYSRAGLSLAGAIKSFAVPGASFLGFAQQSRAPVRADFGRLIAIHGPIALENLPHLRIGNFMTADRSEVECLRTLIQVVLRYVKTGLAKKPLSIGVFGPPGSGKSFAVRELAGELLREKSAWLEFNLSQFVSPADLNGAFHQIRDQVLQGKIPVAFFDEFDSSRYQWLQYLVAPMQDGRFQEGELTHAIGKAIFIFGGGTGWTFDTFGPSEPEPGAPVEPDARRAWNEFVLAKGPDFKSRLDAFFNVAGPNRRAIPVKDTGEKYDFEVFGRRLREDPADTWVSIRRALILRAELGLAREHRLIIEAGLLNALLNVPRFTHGSRSLSKILSPFKSIPGALLQRSSLPPPPQLAMHTDAKEFMALCEGKDLVPSLEATPLSVQAVDRIAPQIHETYRALARRAGRNPDPPFAEYIKCKPFEGQSNYEAARRMPGILALAGLRLVEGVYAGDELRSVRQHIEYHLELLANAEHQGWMDWYLRNGWTYHPDGQSPDQRAQMRHNCLKPFTQLKGEDQAKDREQVRNYPDFALQAGYKIVFA
jgi:hypothetical protein